MNGKTLRTLLLGMGLLALGVLAWGLLANSGGWNAEADQGKLPWGAASSRSSDGPIKFVLTPKGMEGERFLIDIRVDTHSGDLGKIDLKSQVRLTAEGQTFAPTGKVRLGGHHAGGTLSFPLKRAPERFEIVISQVGTMGDLTFRWP